MQLLALSKTKEIIKEFKTFEEMFNYVVDGNYHQIIYRKDFYSNSIIYKENGDCN